MSMALISISARSSKKLEMLKLMVERISFGCPILKISDVYETLTRHLGEKFGLEPIEFPHDPFKVK